MFSAQQESNKENSKGGRPSFVPPSGAQTPFSIYAHQGKGKTGADILKQMKQQSAHREGASAQEPQIALKISTIENMMQQFTEQFKLQSQTMTQLQEQLSSKDQEIANLKVTLDQKIQEEHAFAKQAVDKVAQDAAEARSNLGKDVASAREQLVATAKVELVKDMEKKLLQEQERSFKEIFRVEEEAKRARENLADANKKIAQDLVDIDTKLDAVSTVSSENAAKVTAETKNAIDAARKVMNEECTAAIQKVAQADLDARRQLESQLQAKLDENKGLVDEEILSLQESIALAQEKNNSETLGYVSELLKSAASEQKGYTVQAYLEIMREANATTIYVDDQFSSDPEADREIREGALDQNALVKAYVFAQQISAPTVAAEIREVIEATNPEFNIASIIEYMPQQDADTPLVGSDSDQS